jgi:DeoR family glycerol-3-phosphate regulon repressor
VAEAIIKHARTIFLAADHSKFGRPALVRLGHLNEIDALFTDAPTPPDMADTLAAANLQVYVAQ